MLRYDMPPSRVSIESANAAVIRARLSRPPSIVSPMTTEVANSTLQSLGLRPQDSICCVMLLAKRFRGRHAAHFGDDAVGVFRGEGDARR